MSSQFVLEVVFWGGIVPAVVAAVAALLWLRLLPAQWSRRHVAACAVGGGILAGYILLPASLRPPAVPSRYWHWLPYLSALAAFLGPLGVARGLILVERWLLFLLLALLAAWLLVPTWPDLKPPRSTYVPLMGAYFLLLIALLDPLSEHISSRVLSLSLWFAAIVSALSVWAAISETHGRAGAVVASAWFGVVVLTWLTNAPTALRATAPIYAISVGGATFAGFVYPPDRWELATLVFPLAPLALWATVYGPLSGLSGRKKTVAELAAVGIVVAVGLVLLVVF